MARAGNLGELIESLRTLYDQRITEQQAYESLKDDPRFGTIRLAKIRTLYKQFKAQAKKKPRKAPTQTAIKKPLVKVTIKKPPVQAQVAIEKPLVQIQVAVEKPQTPPKIIVKKPLVDFDARCAKNPDNVSAFALDIFKHMQSQEPNYQLPGFIKKRIKEGNRALIFDWMVSVQDEHAFNHETLYIAIRLFDIYIAAHSSTLTSQLHLIAASSFWIASKFEETKPLNIKAVGKICGKRSTQADCRKMEIEILKTTRCDFGFPLAYSFLRRYARVVGIDIEMLTLARMYLELATHSLEWALESPSKVAAACFVLALRKKKFKRSWAPILEKYSSYTLPAIEELVKRLDDYVDHFKTSFPKCKAVISKYSDEILFEVATKYLI